MPPSKKRITVVFSLVKYRRLGDFREGVIKVKADIGANATIYVTPIPSVAKVNTDFTAMDAAQEQVLQRKAGSVATRNAAYNEVLDDMRKWLRYVQDLIDGEPDPELQMVIATSSGFDIKVNGVQVRPDLKVVPLATPGIVKMAAKSGGKNAAYGWQMSANNGTTWTDLPVTNIAKITVSALNAGTRYLFRFRTTVKNVTSGWSTPVSFIYTVNP